MELMQCLFLPPDREEAQKSSSQSAQPSPITG